MSLSIPMDVTIVPATHRFFDDLVTAISSQAALTAGYATHAGGTYRFEENFSLSFGCYTRQEGRSRLEIVTMPERLLTPITRRSWPNSLHLNFRKVTEVDNFQEIQPTVPYTSPLMGVLRLNANIMEHAFIAYYEKNAELINAARSKNGSEGHPTLLFANVIRNAFAHGGTICFSKRKTGKSATWGGLTYTESDNGRQVMYQDMSQGDVILLMLEMDTLF